MESITLKKVDSGGYYRCQVDLQEHKILWAYGYNPWADFDKRKAAELRDNPDWQQRIWTGQMTIESVLQTYQYRAHLLRAYIGYVEKQAALLGLDYFMKYQMYRSAAVLFWSTGYLLEIPVALTEDEWAELKKDEIVKDLLVRKWPTKKELEIAIEKIRPKPGSSPPPVAPVVQPKQK